MKKIVKGHEPQSFIDWKNDKTEWKQIDDQTALSVKRELKETLVKQQYYLCCYCGELINPKKSGDVVIEHVKPREFFTEDIFNYNNLLASCHGNGQTTHKGSGYKRSDWFTCDARKSSRPINVTPLCENCENRSIYTDDGRIIPLNIKDQEFNNTIKLLGLDAGYLNFKRREVFLEYFPEELDKEDHSYIQGLINSMQQVDANGKLPRFSHQVIEYAKSFLNKTV